MITDNTLEFHHEIFHTLVVQCVVLSLPAPLNLIRPTSKNDEPPYDFRLPGNDKCSHVQKTYRYVKLDKCQNQIVLNKHQILHSP